MVRPKANGMSYTAQLRKAVVEFSSETEDVPAGDFRC